MKTIQLTQGQVALVDDDDYPLVAQRRWYAVRHGRTFYAQSGCGASFVQMHRLILSPREDEQVDHIDHCGTNNTRANLRLCTAEQNRYNSQKRNSVTTSRYKGVYWVPTSRLWRAAIRVDGKVRLLGLFNEEGGAALAYDRAAVEAFGAFACVNLSPAEAEVFAGSAPVSSRRGKPGHLNHNSKLTPGALASIRKSIARGDATLVSIAEAHGVSKYVVGKIKRGQSYRDEAITAALRAAKEKP